ncbi:MAG: hypothetical protein LC808_23105 [Actinobacteria bacterium]|nr:hypothetical protein [Actinomycetota bacterium]
MSVLAQDLVGTGVDGKRVRRAGGIQAVGWMPVPSSGLGPDLVLIIGPGRSAASVALVFM